MRTPSQHAWLSQKTLIILGLCVVAAIIVAAAGLAHRAGVFDPKPRPQPRTGDGLSPPAVTAGLEAVALPLNPDNPDQATIGALRYVAGYALTSDEPRFGGISGLVHEGHQIRAISDAGVWITIPLDGGLVPAAPVTIQDLHTAEWRKRSTDTESLLPIYLGYLIGVEYGHYILRTTAPGGNLWRLNHSGMPPLQHLPKNRGLEAMTWLADDRLLLFAEGSVAGGGRLPAWALDGSVATRFTLIPSRNFRPTDAATLPGGDVILLLRSFSATDGVAIKIGRIPAGAFLVPDADLQPEILATLAPPLTVDNLEALDVVPADNGDALLFMMSDDNYSGLQRTLLLVFRLSGQSSPVRLQPIG